MPDAALERPVLEDATLPGIASISTLLDRSRQALLDLSLRNRLLSVPRQSKNARVIHVVDELSTEIYRLLMQEGKTMTFLPVRERVATQETGDADVGALPQPDENEKVDERGIAARHRDRHLQTLLTSAGLQKRLLSMYYDARTFEEEQGVNILYLSLGMLRWFEADSSDTERFSPLLLIPVELERGSATERFRLKWRGEEVAANLSLQAKMKAEFGLVIPDLPQGDDIDVSAYMKTVAQSVHGKKRFEVRENEATLGFFSFAKFLMYRDLDPQNWPQEIKLDKNPLISGLLRDGFPGNPNLIDEDDSVDAHIHPVDMCHVVDADSSQTLAIEEVRRGQHLVIQGPPGTGKSQTIANLIASAVAQGKKVLFVAEKMAALEVVHRRLSSVGLGPICLEFHSNKANKRQLLEELRRTLNLGRPRGNDQGYAAASVAQLRTTLNRHAAMLHTLCEPCGLTPYQIMGQLLRLKDNGIQATSISLEKPADWTPQETRERMHLLEDIAARLHEMGSVNQHPWRGVERDSLLPSEYERLQQMVEQLEKHIEKMLMSTRAIEQGFPLDGAADLLSIENTLLTARHFLQMPEMDTAALGNEVWLEKISSIQELVENGKRLHELKAALLPQVKDIAWETDVTECRQHLAAYGGSFFSFLHAPYRHSRRFLASLLSVPLPKDHEEHIALLDGLIEAQRREKQLKENAELGAQAFGRAWEGALTDWEKARRFVEWRAGLPESLTTQRFLCAGAAAVKSDVEPAFHVLDSTLPEFWKAWDEMAAFLALEIPVAFGLPEIKEVSRDGFHEHIQGWKQNLEAISKWIALRNRLENAKSIGMSSLIERLEQDELAADKLVLVFERAYYDALAEKVFGDSPELRAFDGDRHQDLVTQFRASDLKRIEQARVEVKGIHFNGMPRNEGGTGALGVLQGEFAKKRNNLPIRQLMKRAGAAIQAIKPVFMRSPLSVAQFLEPGAVAFDLLLIDEASQVEPVDAFGAIARAKQVVVVGDSRQLPPTRFFSKMTSNDSEENEDEDGYNLAAQDVESILGMCLAKGLPERMLRWHYRSKHPSLIAVSNKEFYENKLFIVPSPYDQASGTGLRFHHLPNAFFQGGAEGTGTNPIEAKAVAHSVLHHAKEHPLLSLGVAAFSVKQKQAIMDEVELLRRANPEVEPFFTQSHPNEPFFVKNIENIQGDERDVIFISIGYGRNPQGYMAMRFGPLSGEGGERRLNVLISRAKRRCEVFSSITADDIDLERARGHGVSALKLFLKFAQTGKLDFGRTTEREADSVFEEQVAAALRVRGYDVKNQVGIAGFFIDIAVADPDKPGRFILGIECDGASYHSSRSARDRDRLRQAVLEANGWIIHRIWSTDWFRRPQEQLEKTIAAIEKAKSALSQKTLENRPVFEISTVERDDISEMTVAVKEQQLTTPYQEAQFPVAVERKPHEVPDNEMAEIVTRIIAIEGPVHEQEIITRVRTLWNLGRAGSRIQQKVKGALRYAKRKGMIQAESSFYLTPDAAITVRNRSEASSPGLRKPEYLPPQEIRQAIVAVIEANFGADKDALPTEVARLLGFQSTSAQLREVIETKITSMLRKGVLSQMENTLSVKTA